MFNNVYQNKTVLVTGHTGFKGAWLTLWLVRLGAKVVGYSLAPPTKPNLLETLQLKNKIKHIFGDVRDLTHLKKVIDDAKPDIIFHLAAQSLVKRSYHEPVETFSTNIMGTVNLLEAVRQTKKNCLVIIITSDKCYENKEWFYGYRESDVLGGRDPYSASKGCAEFVTLAYRQSFPDMVGLATARAGNVIGGGDWAENRLVPDCIRALTKKRTIVLRNPQAIRPWQHILEPLSGYLWLATLLHKNPTKYNEAWNFGPKDESIISVERIVKEIITLWGNGSIKVIKSKYYEPQLLKLDINKARERLHWRPIYGMHQAIEETINWYKCFYQKKENMCDFSMAQIKEYEKEAKKSHLTWSR